MNNNTNDQLQQIKQMGLCFCFRKIKGFGCMNRSHLYNHIFKCWGTFIHFSLACTLFLSQFLNYLHGSITDLNKNRNIFHPIRNREHLQGQPDVSPKSFSISDSLLLKDVLSLQHKTTATHEFDVCIRLRWLSGGGWHAALHGQTCRWLCAE